jgi:LytS/YehU family sensor histidine kinase
VAYFLDDAEVLTIAAPVTEALAGMLEHVQSNHVFEDVAEVFHMEAATVPERATLVRWFGRIERKDPHERSTG